MSSIESVIKGARRIEGVLEKDFGAEGKGLHEKLSSVESKLPQELQRRIRWIATMRNKTVHEEGFEPDSIEDFNRACEDIVEKLNFISLEKKKKAQEAKKAEDRFEKEVSNRVRAEIERKKREDERRASAHSNRRLQTPESGANIKKDSQPKTGGWGLAIALVAIVIATTHFYGEDKAIKSNGANEVVVKSQHQPSSVSNTKGAGSTNTFSQSTGKAKQVSVKKVSLKEKAQVSNDEFKEATESIERRVFDFMKKKTSVTIGSVDVVSSDRPGYSNVLINVAWQVDGDFIADTLSRYLSGRNSGPIKVGSVDFSDHMGKKVNGIKVKHYNNKGNKQKTPYSEKLYQYLVSKQVAIEVIVDKYKGHITIASGRECFVSCSGVGDEQYQIHTRSGFKGPTMMGYLEENPIVIKNVPSDKLEDIKEISYQIVVKG